MGSPSRRRRRVRTKIIPVKGCSYPVESVLADKYASGLTAVTSGANSAHGESVYGERLKFGYFTLTDNSIGCGPRRKVPTRFIAEVIERAIAGAGEIYAGVAAGVPLRRIGRAALQGAEKHTLREVY
jgi:hypothetical protein